LKLSRRNKLVLPKILCNPFSIDWSDRKFLDESAYNPIESNGHSPRFVLSPWSECSTTCGPGVRMRSAECVAAHPIAGMIRLPHSECQEQSQPSLFESCETRPCPLQEDSKTSKEEAPFKWENGDWGPCSESCLGGKQKAALLCRETASGRAVPWSNCDARTRPPQLVRQCNQHACPPQWQVGDFGVCSVSCGTGSAIRSVRCIRPVSRSGGADAHIVLRDAECPLPKPSENESCGAVECPASWITGDWTECSTSCGSGEQKRSVVCEGRDINGRRERRPEKECSDDKPPAVQMCSLGRCSKPQLLSNRVFEQNASEKKLTLGIGGMATLYQGTSIKIKCPRKNFDKKKIYWTRNGRRIKNDAHIKVSANGNLRIFHARMEDAGVYECYTNKLQGNVTLRFKYRDDDKVNLPSLRDRQVGTRLVWENNSAGSIHRWATSILSAGNYAEAAKELQKHREILQARWEMGHWTECKQSTCGVAGYQAREVTCSAIIDGARQNADRRLCTVLASTPPPETRPCHKPECPRWEASEWSECLRAPCVRNGVAKQRRDVRCLTTNGDVVDEQNCDKTQRPKSRKECENNSCKAEWHASDWGSCSSNCGTGGVQLRLLSCVWATSRLSAGRNCDGRRPPAARACPFANTLPPCRPTLITSLSIQNCRNPGFICVRQKCCATCKYVEKRSRR
uniref:Ig-like domain-containing protein n=1 Tax=Angiostrongylus cantonensis TaxID=6313 RepID=A0A158P8F3_ANGCA